MKTFIPPIAEIIFHSKFPILSTGLPSRTVFLAGVSFSIISAFGIEAIKKEKLKKIIIPIAALLTIYLILWVLTFVLNIDAQKIAVTKRNLILPTGIAFLISAVILARKYTQRAFILWLGMFLCVRFE